MPDKILPSVSPIRAHQAASEGRSLNKICNFTAGEGYSCRIVGMTAPQRKAGVYRPKTWWDTSPLHRALKPWCSAISTWGTSGLSEQAQPPSTRTCSRVASLRSSTSGWLFCSSSLAAWHCATRTGYCCGNEHVRKRCVHTRERGRDQWEGKAEVPW